MKSTDRTYQNIIHQAACLCRVNKSDVGVSKSNKGLSFAMARPNIKYDYLLTKGTGKDVIVYDKEGKKFDTLKVEQTKVIKAEKRKPSKVQADNDNGEATGKELL